MRRVLLALALVGLVTGYGLADINDLSGGVMITHHPPGLVYTSDPTPWCEDGYFEIGECPDGVNATVPFDPDYTPWVWYVVAAWTEEKQWAVYSFGFGDYDGSIFLFVDYGACDPGTEILEFSTGGWPGPNEGTTVGWTGTPWVGNYVPLYWFGGYVYYDGAIPVDVDPGQNPPFCGFVDVLNPPTGYDVEPENRGILGVNTEGYVPCPQPPQPEAVCCVGEDCYIVTEEDCEGMGGEFHPEWDTCDPNPCLLPHACCFGDGSCAMLFEQECADQGGVFHPEWDTCDPNPCPQPAVCCVGCDCYIVLEEECDQMGGDFYPEWDSCDPNPCPGSPSEEASWSTIKALYR